jgi:16S rRNA (cytosine967-C5)-methyltransferase
MKIRFGKSLRADAAWVLFQVLEEGRSCREVMPLVVDEYSATKDRNWLNEAVLGILRNLPILQTWLRPRLKKPLKGDKKMIEHLLILGLYQLKYMRVSAHAAINETVSACTVLQASSLKGLVNAILRDAQRNELTEPDDKLLSSGLPKWIFKSIHTHYPLEAQNIIENMNSKAPIWLRVNSHKISFEDYCNHLKEADVQHEIPNNISNAVIVNHANVLSLPGFKEGWFAVQDGAAQQAATLLNPQAGEHILDCCSAPGGKACHIFSLAPKAYITALDSSEKRLQRVAENCSRLDCSMQILTGDASNPSAWWNNQPFDKILLDAPCSATGVIRRHPDIRWLRKGSDIGELVALQAKIIRAIWPTLKSGGTLLYATCSILPEENQQQIDAFMQETHDASRNMEDIQILPGDEQMDGFYYARLIKS